jgi:hypothetical protein
MEEHMKLSNLIVPTTSPAGVILIEPYDDWRIEIIGSTVQTSVDGKKAGRVNAVSIALKRGESGMLAVVVTTGYGKRECLSYHGYFVHVTWERDGEKPFLNKECQWLPTDPTRLGQIVGEHLEVSVDGVIFTTNHYDRDKHGYRYVADANLFCRYLFGTATKEEVETAATECTAEISMRKELERANADLKCMLDERARLVGEKNEIWGKLKGSLADLELVSAERDKGRIMSHDIRRMLVKFRDAHWPFCTKRCVVKRLAEILAPIPPEK